MSLTRIILVTALLSFMPISELRGAIPFAIANGIPWYWAYIFAVVLNILVAPVCWVFLATVHKLMYGTASSDPTCSDPQKTGSDPKFPGFRWYRSFFDKIVERSRKKLSAGVEKWGWLGISLFVAIPLPITGAWTGTLGAWVLGVRKRKTMLAVCIGVPIAGVVVTAIVMFGVEALNFLVKRL